MFQYFQFFLKTHRLVERGAILVSLLEQPEQYTNEQIKGLLETTLRTPQAQEFLRRTEKPKPSQRRKTAARAEKGEVKKA